MRRIIKLLFIGLLINNIHAIKVNLNHLVELVSTIIYLHNMPLRAPGIYYSVQQSLVIFISLLLIIILPFIIVDRKWYKALWLSLLCSSLLPLLVIIGDNVYFDLAFSPGTIFPLSERIFGPAKEFMGYSIINFIGLIIINHPKVKKEFS